MNMSCRVLLTLSLLTAFHSQTAGKLITKPRDTDIQVNQSTYFNCSTDIASTSIFWFHGKTRVYIGFTILVPYTERFAIDKSEWNGTYIYNLVIHSVQPIDAGEYICSDDEGYGEKYSVQLIVLVADPICRSNKELDEIIGQNDCNIEPDDVELECRVAYHGNIPPRMEWKKVGEDSSAPLEASNVTSGNYFISTLKLKGDIALNNSSFVCETKRTTQEPNKCTSKVMKIVYAMDGNATLNRTLKDEIHCNANTSQSCIYKWKWLQDNHFTIESSASVLRAKKQGWHRCEAECYLKNRTCILLVMRAIIIADNDYGETGDSSQTRNIIIAVVVTVVVTLVVAFVVIIVLAYCCSETDKGEPTAAAAADVAADDVAVDFESPIEDERISYDFESSSEERVSLNVLPHEPLPVINGIAILGQDVFVSRLQRTYFDVYNSTTFGFQRQMIVEGMANPEHIVSCSVNNCLYTVDMWLDSPSPAIQRIKPTDGVLIKTWFVPEGGDRLSIAKDANVILNINHEAKLLEYTADGTLIRKINLGSGTGIMQVWHAVKLESGLFVVCQSDCGGLLSRVCLLSTKATIKISEVIDDVEILTIFGAEEDESVRLKKPTYLSVGTDGSILVLDESRKQVVLLSSNLDNPRVLISEEHALESPSRTCFDEFTCQWLVVDNHSVVVCRMVDDEVERERHYLSKRAMRYW